MRSRAPSPPQPTEDEIAAREETRRLNEAQRQMIERQTRQLDEERKRTEAEATDVANRRRREEEAAAGGRTGMRSLLSGNWTGYRRGGDLAGQ